MVFQIFIVVALEFNISLVYVLLKKVISAKITPFKFLLVLIL